MKHFKNKNILVTGGAGFIGSHLTKRLVRAQAKVSVTVKYNSIINCPRLLSVWEKINIRFFIDFIYDIIKWNRWYYIKIIMENIFEI